MTWREKKKNTKRSEQATTYGDLFDIGKNMENLEGEHLLFYQQQLGRKTLCRLSLDEVDEEYVLEEQHQMQIEQEAAEAEEIIESYVFDPIFDEVYPTSSRGVKPQTQSRAILVDKQTQTEFTIAAHQPDIRNVRNLTEESKDAIATVSYRAGVSIQKARVAVKATVEKLCGWVYQLDPPSLETIWEEGEETSKSRW